MDEPSGAIRIDGREYEIPTSFRIGETRTIKRMTGLNPPEFLEELGRLDETQDPDVSAAMVWWIMHREDPAVKPESLDDIEWGSIESDTKQAKKVDDPEAPGSLSSTPDFSGSSADEREPSANANGETTRPTGGKAGSAAAR